ncbi:hypothetical protein vBAcoSR7M_13 [Alteromonas phage vB_AcoS-R7M]|uniref:Uncharacterized protein n=1 Tax=Alteromonas phage vB_AcoS-R7M TaxID=2729541 RepID=A0A6M3YNB5_9CAUD|nr:hypothetical protein HWD34_gp13 [Alteromonas phage vB_AcoS-R7M]QJI53335.1 hypothetical protein vBAcoSR7M_13 [Alteromonas phage vB_AcoS-R7M]
MSDPNFFNFKMEGETPDPRRLQLSIDGNPIKGAREVIVRGGISGYTNVVVEMEACLSVDVCAAYFVKTEFDDDLYNRVSTCLVDVCMGTEKENQGVELTAEVLKLDRDGRVKFVEDLMCELRQRVGF